MPGRGSAATPPTSPIVTFEANLHRVSELIAIHGVLKPGPGKPQQWRSDIAAATIVMTVAAVDTYFNDRLRADFERRFDSLEEKQFARLLARMLGGMESITGTDSLVPLALALQSGEPKKAVGQQFAKWVEGETFQEPTKIETVLQLFGVDRCWNHVGTCWAKKYGDKKPVDKMFREWADRRHGIAHRSGRSRARGTAHTGARHGKSATRDEAIECVEFFRRLIGLVDFHLNSSIYGRQPRKRASDVAVFDLDRAVKRVRPRAKPRGARRGQPPAAAERAPAA